MSKEAFTAAHERLVAAEMVRTGCDFDTAYDRTADAAYEAMREDAADKADMLRQMRKDGAL